MKSSMIELNPKLRPKVEVARCEQQLEPFLCVPSLHPWNSDQTGSTETMEKSEVIWEDKGGLSNILKYPKSPILHSLQFQYEYLKLNQFPNQV